MSTVAIECDAVWKKYRRGDHLDSLRDFVPALFSGLLAGRRPADLASAEFWALKNVSFQVRSGQALGIIGPNGAGKSTLLKLLTRILQPTRGGCAVRGRIGALIEVAAGFHPDLTGAENIYLQGSIMGMTSAEITRNFDAIVNFAGVRDFIDTPVKRYSSGMHARLGFSIAAHLDPDVLLIDEVLSVGDMAFQERCIERMEEFKRQGVAIAFVSHNLQAVAQLCDEALYLQGSVRAYGPVHTVLETYVRAASRDVPSTAAGEVDILSARLLDPDVGPMSVAAPGAPLTLRVTYRARSRISDLTLGFIVHRSTDGLVVYDANVRSEELDVVSLLPGEEITVDFAFRTNLTRGQYHLECHAFHNPSHRFLSRLCPAALLTVSETRTHGGVAHLALKPRLVHRVTQDLNPWVSAEPSPRATAP